MRTMVRHNCVIFLLFILSLSPLSAQTDNHTGNNFFLSTYGTPDSIDAGRPVFPPASVAERVRTKHRVVGYPRMSITSGPAVRYQRTKELSALHRSVEESFGTTIQDEDLKNSFLSMNLGFKYSPKPEFGFLLEKSWGRTPPHNTISFSSITLIMYISFLRSDLFALYAGGGVANQEFESKRDYDRRLLDGGILDYVRFSSGHRIAVPLELSMDLWPFRVSQYVACNISVRYFIASPVKLSNHYAGGSDQRVYSIPLDGFRIGAFLLLSY
jgi:hypothetical protein